jgi:hypothetical protein
MALDVTVGGYQAESFATLEEAEVFLAEMGIALNAWQDLSNDAKEFRLRVAARLMGAGMFPLGGEQVYEYQALCFPRTCQTDVTEVPDDVKRAQCLVAILVVEPNFTEDSSSTVSPIVLEDALIKSVKVMGVLEVGLQNTVDPVTTRTVTHSTTSVSSRLSRTYGGMMNWLLAPYLVQIRGGTVLPASEVVSTKLTSPDYEA